MLRECAVDPSQENGSSLPSKPRDVSFREQAPSNVLSGVQAGSMHADAEDMLVGLTM